MSADSGAADLPSCPHCGEDHPDDKLKCPTTDLLLPLAGRILHDKFRFVELIGRGGMAEVWLARNELVDREVALKLIRPEVARHQENVAGRVPPQSCHTEAVDTGDLRREGDN